MYSVGAWSGPELRWQALEVGSNGYVNAVHRLWQYLRNREAPAIAIRFLEAHAAFRGDPVLPPRSRPLGRL